MKFRRALLIALAVSLTVARSVRSADQPRMRRIGVLLGRVRPPSIEAHPRYGAWLRRLKELGYAEGQNAQIEWRFANGEYGKLPALAAELVALRVDVIFAWGSESISAAQAATSTIPIVFWGGTDVVKQGFVRSLAHPGGHTTSVTFLYRETLSKQFECLKAMVPHLTRIPVFVNPQNPATNILVDEAQELAKQMGITLTIVPTRSDAEIDSAIREAATGGAQGVVWTMDDLLLDRRQHIADASLRNHMPSSGPISEYAEDGGLLGYGIANWDALIARTADYIDLILKGATPGDMPVEQPEKFQLVINGKTAHALGLAIAAELLLEAARVIE